MGAALFTASCLKAPTGPSLAPRLEGNYVLAVQVSPACALPTSRYQWAVQAQTVGTGAGAQVRITLPKGDDAVDLSLTYAADPNSTESAPPIDQVRGSISSNRAHSGATLRVTIQGQAQGTVGDAVGRGMVESGTFNGKVSLTNKSDQEDPIGDSLGSCTAADHGWSLTPP
jgi:hypothetical protein